MHHSLGKMTVYHQFSWREQPCDSIQQIVAAFLRIGEATAIRWIETSKGILLLQAAPENPASGAIYIFDRQREEWYLLSFEGCEDQFTSESFDRIYSEYQLFTYVEEPGRLLAQIHSAHA